jgi:outer membrane protein assembly factor BamB
LIVLIDGYQLFALDVKTGKPRWEQAIGLRPLMGEEPPALLHGEQFLYVSQGWLESRSAATGALNWRRPLANLTEASTLTTQGAMVLLLSGDGSSGELAVWALPHGEPTQRLFFSALGARPRLRLAGDLALVIGSEHACLLEVDRGQDALRQDAMKQMRSHQ